MRIRVAAVALLFATIAVTVTGCSSGGAVAASATPGSSASVSSNAGSDSATLTLIEATCTKCHPIVRVKAATHDGAGWTVTITRMRRVHGAPIDEAQANQIIDFLAAGGASRL